MRSYKHIMIQWKGYVFGRNVMCVTVTIVAKQERERCASGQKTNKIFKSFIVFKCISKR